MNTEPDVVAGAGAARGDSIGRAAIVFLVDGFYGRVRADDILGPTVDGVARVDWARHLSKMYDFWESLLFGTVRFKGNPLEVHRALARGASMPSTAFDRWLQLFHESVDALFAGPFAEEAKARASRIATVFQHHITADDRVALHVS